MAIQFTQASSQILRNDFSDRVVPQYPFCMGMWFYPTAAGNSTARKMWWAGDSAVSNNYWSIGLSATNLWQIIASNTVARTTTTAAGITATANQWHYIVVRMETSGGRNVQGLGNGEFLTSQNGAGAASPTSNSSSIGGPVNAGVGGYFDGFIAEWWWINRGFQNIVLGAATNLDRTTVRALAFGGPFSPVGQYLLGGPPTEYRPFLSAPVPFGSGQVALAGPENYYQGNAIQKWTNVNAAKFGAPPPPLPPEYIRPGQIKGKLVL